MFISFEITLVHTLNDNIYIFTKILEVNLFAFAYRLFHEDFSPIDGALHMHIYMCMGSNPGQPGKYL